MAGTRTKHGEWKLGREVGLSGPGTPGELPNAALEGNGRELDRCGNERWILRQPARTETMEGGSSYGMAQAAWIMMKEEFSNHGVDGGDGEAQDDR